MTDESAIPISFDDPVALAEELLEPREPTRQQAALHWAYGSPDAAAPVVAELLRQAAERAEACAAGGEEAEVALSDVLVDAAWLASLLAADLGLEAVKPSLERLFALPPDWVEALFGDMITEHGPEIISGCSGGDAEWCLSFVAEPYGFWIQVAAIAAVERLAHAGVLDPEAAATRIAAFLLEDPNRTWPDGRGLTWDTPAWNASVVSLLCDLDPNPFRDRLDALFDAELVDLQTIDHADYEACLETPGAYRFERPFGRLAEYVSNSWQLRVRQDETRALERELASAHELIAQLETEVKAMQREDEKKRVAKAAKEKRRTKEKRAKKARKKNRR